MQQWYKLNPQDRRKVNIVSMTASAVGAVLNIAVIIAIVVDPLKVLCKGPWITILSLAIADVITCISSFLLWGSEDFNPARILLYDQIVDYFWGFGYSASFLMLTFFTVQIFFITKYPMKSRYWLTTTKIILFGMGLWFLAILLGLGNIAWVHFQWQESLKISIAQYGILEIVTIVQVALQIQVAVEIVKSGRRISENDEITKHKKIAKTVIILTLVLFITALPYFVLRQIEFSTRLKYFGENKTIQILKCISVLYTPIAMMNFVANPILYSLRLPDYKNSLLAMVGLRTSYVLQNSKTIRRTEEIPL